MQEVQKVLLHFFFHCLPLAQFIFFQKKREKGGAQTHLGSMITPIMHPKCAHWLCILITGPNVSWLHQRHFNWTNGQSWKRNAACPNVCELLHRGIKKKCSNTFIFPVFKTYGWFKSNVFCTLCSNSGHGAGSWKWYCKILHQNNSNAWEQSNQSYLLSSVQVASPTCCHFALAIYIDCCLF
jgi:hypothetical protein